MYFKQMLNTSYMIYIVGIVFFLIFFFLWIGSVLVIPRQYSGNVPDVAVLCFVALPYLISVFWMRNLIHQDMTRAAKAFGGKFEDGKLICGDFKISRYSDSFIIRFPSKAGTDIGVSSGLMGWNVKIGSQGKMGDLGESRVRDWLAEMRSRGYNIRELRRKDGDVKAVVEFGPYDGDGLIECAKDIQAFFEIGWK
jgi:hypothetical protein